MDITAPAVRPARPGDVEAWLDLLEAVAAEGRWLGTEAPIERGTRRQRFLDFVGGSGFATFVADAEGRLVGSIGVEHRNGIAELWMLVDEAWRGRGVGSRLLESCVAWARDEGAHKVALRVWPHNAAAIALYRTHGFVKEGRLRRHYRRRNGELWDALQMGLVLDDATPGSPYPDAPLA